ncbi:MAG: hypothetical protein C5B48_11850 [Candidatus Rokuibacteriota bacterium]|nr:MAG: hypothetical protein C5B48_11850 [Candidatus Rokubacteria bacterium]
MPLVVNLPEWDQRSERLIALMRLVLASGALAVIWLDPTQPAKHWKVAYTAFVLYVLYSAVVFKMVRSRPRPWLPITTQVLDLAWIPPVLYFTEGANTPFFPFFVIFTLSAGMRWGLWGSWAVTIYSLIVYGWLLFVETPTPLNLNNDLMRLGYLLIVGALGGYLAEYRRQREAELRMLQTIAEAMGAAHGAVSAMTAVVDMTGRLGLADVVVGVLREPDDGEVLMVRGQSEIARLSNAEAIPFFAAASGPPLARGTRAVRLTGTAAVLLRFAEADSGLAYPIRTGADLVGAIFFFVRAPRAGRHASDEFLSLLLRHVIPQLETLYVLERARHAYVLEERRRIARDLHDSFIQVLAALGLRLAALCAVPAAEPAAKRLQKEMVQIREIIARELERVRAYLAEMREPLAEIGNLRELLHTTTEAFRSRTGISVALDLADDVTEVSGEVVRELAPLLREALANVEKHARASLVTVSAGLKGHQLTLVVRDDGIGIRIPDSSETERVPGHGQGLYSMRERARLLGGRLTLERPDSGGTMLVVSIPLPALV